MPKKYVRVKDRRVGLAVKDRPQSKVEKNGNQWIITPKQMMFVENWLTPNSPTFGNAYQSARSAGFSHQHSAHITTEAFNLEWVNEAKRRLIRFNPEHIVQKLQDMTNASKDSDKIRALELLARVNGMFIDRSIVANIDVKFTNDIPRPTYSDSKPLTDDK